jgi:hypothetical protein
MPTIGLRILEKNVQRGQYINLARREAPLGGALAGLFRKLGRACSAPTGTGWGMAAGLDLQSLERNAKQIGVHFGFHVSVGG